MILHPALIRPISITKLILVFFFNQTQSINSCLGLACLNLKKSGCLASSSSLFLQSFTPTKTYQNHQEAPPKFLLNLQYQHQDLRTFGYRALTHNTI